MCCVKKELRTGIAEELDLDLERFMGSWVES